MFKVEKISSTNNVIIKDYINLRNNKRYRRKSNSCIVEGERLIEDCLVNNIKFKYILVDESRIYKYNKIIKQINNKNIKLHYIISDISKKLSDTVNSQGIFGVVMTSFLLDINTTIINQRKNFLVLDGINDPTNMGTIIRSCVAFGFKDIILSKECVDIFSPKVIRGSMGNVFKVNIFFSDDLIKFLKKLSLNGYKLFATSLDKSSKSVIDKKIKCNFAIVFGNEANGVSLDVLDFCDEKIYIPMDNTVESLNVSVASSIIMWEIFKNNL